MQLHRSYIPEAGPAVLEGLLEGLNELINVDYLEDFFNLIQHLLSVNLLLLRGN